MLSLLLLTILILIMYHRYFLILFFFLPRKQAAKTAPYLYDAVWLYAHALNRTLTDGKNKSNGTEILRNVITTKPLFTGKYCLTFYY